MRRYTAVLLIAVVAAPACRCKPPSKPHLDGVAGEVQAAYAERIRKLPSFRYEGVAEQADQRTAFKLEWAEPNRGRLELSEPKMAFTFDGRRFRKWDDGTQTVVEIDLKDVPAERASAFLRRVFGPFVPEGWVAPPFGSSVSAQRRTESERPVVEIVCEPIAGDAGAKVAFVFAGPSMNLVRRVAATGELRVIDERCDERLGLCVPSKFEERPVAGAPTVTTLSAIEFGPKIADERFVLAVPDGARLERRELPE